MSLYYDVTTDYLYLEGKKKEQFETVIRCLQEDLDYDVISSITLMSIDKIKEIEKGFKEGIKREQKRIIILSLENGKNYDEIVKFTGISLEEIEEIDKQRKYPFTHNPPPAN